jgi:hypothetical protein
MVAWERIPWPLWAYCGLMVLSAVVVTATTDGPVIGRVGVVIVLLAWAFVLLLDIRWIWTATLVILVLVFISEVASGRLRWYGIVLTSVEFVLLLHPLTRQFYSASRYRQEGADT